jgi:hypothetical protein
MKIRKTRIKKTTKANASVQYVAEYKWGFWWYQFNDSMGPSGNARHIYSSYKIELRRKGDYYHKTEEQTKALIDFYIDRVKYQNACEIENKVVKVEYEGYP